MASLSLLLTGKDFAFVNISLDSVNEEIQKIVAGDLADSSVGDNGILLIFKSAEGKAKLLRKGGMAVYGVEYLVEDIPLEPSRAGPSQIKQVETKAATPKPLKKPKFMKVKDISPESKGVNLIVICVKAPVAVHGNADLTEVVCGDDTGIVNITLRSEEHVALCKIGDALRVQNAHTRMVKGFIRLVVDKWSSFKCADLANADFDAVDENNDVSATEYELT